MKITNLQELRASTLRVNTRHEISYKDFDFFLIKAFERKRGIYYKLICPQKQYQEEAKSIAQVKTSLNYITSKWKRRAYEIIWDKSSVDIKVLEYVSKIIKKLHLTYPLKKIKKEYAKNMIIYALAFNFNIEKESIENKLRKIHNKFHYSPGVVPSGYFIEINVKYINSIWYIVFTYTKY